MISEIFTLIFQRCCSLCYFQFLLLKLYLVWCFNLTSNPILLFALVSLQNRVQRPPLAGCGGQHSLPLRCPDLTMRLYWHRTVSFLRPVRPVWCRLGPRSGQPRSAADSRLGFLTVRPCGAGLHGPHTELTLNSLLLNLEQ